MELFSKTRPVERRFSAAAGTYDAQSRVHASLADSLLQGVQAKAPARILDVGAGTGILTSRLQQQFPQAHIVALDISRAMLDQCTSTAGSERPIERMHQDFLTARFEQPFDFICSSSALHWMQPIERTLHKVYENLLPKGHFSAAIITANTFWRLREAQAHATGQAAIPPFLPSIEAWTQALKAGAFNLQALSVHQHPEFHPKAQCFLKYLNETGVTGESAQAVRLTRGQVQRLTEYYDRHFMTEQGVLAEYEVLTVHCTKA